MGMEQKINQYDIADNTRPLLYVLDTMKQRSGVTAVVMNYYRNIDRSDVTIDFLIYEDSEKEIVEEIESRGGKVYFMPKLTGKNIYKYIRYLNEFFDLHREYTIIHSHFNQIDSIIFPIAKKYGKRCCISHSHNTKYSEYPIRAFRNAIMCLPLKWEADVWAACGIKAGEFLYGKHFMKSSKHLVVNNAIDIDRFRYDINIRTKKRRELKIENDFVIGTVGSLKPQKNQSFLLDVFSGILNCKTDFSIKLLIVGDGELRNELEEKAAKLNIADNVIFLGTRSDVAELMQAFDVFVLPSLYEGLPVVGVEAQAAGLPCVFSSSITKEVKVCNSKYLSLNRNATEWAKIILSYKDFDRQDCSLMIINSGFSIKDEALRITDFYKSKMKCL